MPHSCNIYWTCTNAFVILDCALISRFVAKALWRTQEESSNFKLLVLINIWGKVSSLGSLMVGIPGAKKWIKLVSWLDDGIIRRHYPDVVLLSGTMQ